MDVIFGFLFQSVVFWFCCGDPGCDVQYGAWKKSKRTLGNPSKDLTFLVRRIFCPSGWAMQSLKAWASSVKFSLCLSFCFKAVLTIVSADSVNSVCIFTTFREGSRQSWLRYLHPSKPAPRKSCYSTATIMSFFCKVSARSLVSLNFGFLLPECQCPSYFPINSI